MIRFVETDGGRSEAGFKGKAAGDCVCRAFSIASGRPYSEVYALIEELSKTERPSPKRGKRSAARTGVFKGTLSKLADALGFQWVPTMKIGQGCRVHLREDELPSGRIIVNLSRHVCAVIDGVIHDNHNPARGGQRCVYGYWIAPEK